jgi:hypothetical protein
VPSVSVGILTSPSIIEPDICLWLLAESKKRMNFGRCVRLGFPVFDRSSAILDQKDRLTRRHVPAQAQSIRQRALLSRPVRAHILREVLYPGRCPGLSYAAPLGLKRLECCLRKRAHFPDTLDAYAH